MTAQWRNALLRCISVTKFGYRSGVR